MPIISRRGVVEYRLCLSVRSMASARWKRTRYPCLRMRCVQARSRGRSCRPPRPRAPRRVGVSRGEAKATRELRRASACRRKTFRRLVPLLEAHQKDRAKHFACIDDQLAVVSRRETSSVSRRRSRSSNVRHVLRFGEHESVGERIRRCDRASVSLRAATRSGEMIGASASRTFLLRRCSGACLKML